MEDKSNKKLEEKKLSDLGIPSTPSRLLDDFASLNMQTIDIFVADSSVLIVPTDSMFTSYDGAPGTTLQTENSYLRAMNCSLRFP